MSKKKCRKCGDTKALSEYYNDKAFKDGLKSSCKVCSNVSKKEYNEEHKQKISTHKESYNKRTKLAQKDHYYKRTYGITLEEYNQMFSDQEGKCKICNIHQSELSLTLAVDHCHSTGKVRGLLCGKCNMALGLMEDNTEILTKAIKYLKEKL